jgi:hypothetical protein
MRDVDTLLRALDGPRSEAPAPDWAALRAGDRARTRTRVLVALAAVAALAIVVTARPETAVGLRGATGIPTVDLRMVADRGDGAVRLTEGGIYHVGDRVFFRLAASPGARVSLWVDGPLGRETIADVDAGAAPEDVRSGDGLVAYAFDAPGRYAFVAGAAGDPDCVGCARHVVEVR